MARHPEGVVQESLIGSAAKFVSNYKILLLAGIATLMLSGMAETETLNADETSDASTDIPPKPELRDGSYVNPTEDHGVTPHEHLYVPISKRDFFTGLITEQCLGCGNIIQVYEV